MATIKNVNNVKNKKPKLDDFFLRFFSNFKLIFI